MPNIDERHRCEVRYWLARGPDAFRAALPDMTRRRGAEAVKRLRDEVRQQYALGNRGERGEWKEAA